MTLYTDWQADAAPVWLQRPSGRAWNETGGLLKDVVVDAARVATQAAFPLSAPLTRSRFLGASARFRVFQPTRTRPTARRFATRGSSGRSEAQRPA